MAYDGGSEAKVLAWFRVIQAVYGIPRPNVDFLVLLNNVVNLEVKLPSSPAVNTAERAERVAEYGCGAVFAKEAQVLRTELRPQRTNLVRTIVEGLTYFKDFCADIAFRRLAKRSNCLGAVKTRRAEVVQIRDNWGQRPIYATDPKTIWEDGVIFEEQDAPIYRAELQGEKEN